jgi:hypothetical protein
VFRPLIAGMHPTDPDARRKGRPADLDYRLSR